MAAAAGDSGFDCTVRKEHLSRTLHLQVNALACVALRLFVSQLKYVCGSFFAILLYLYGSFFLRFILFYLLLHESCWFFFVFFIFAV